MPAARGSDPAQHPGSTVFEGARDVPCHFHRVYRHQSAPRREFGRAGGMTKPPNDSGSVDGAVTVVMFAILRSRTEALRRISGDLLWTAGGFTGKAAGVVVTE